MNKPPMTASQMNHHILYTCILHKCKWTLNKTCIYCKHFQLPSLHQLFQIWYGGTKYRKLTHGYIAWTHWQENYQLVWSCASTDCFQVSVGKKLSINIVLIKKELPYNSVKNCVLNYISKVCSFSLLKIRWIESASSLLNGLHLSVISVCLFFTQNLGCQSMERMTCLSIWSYRIIQLIIRQRKEEEYWLYSKWQNVHWTVDFGQWMVYIKCKL